MTPRLSVTAFRLVVLVAVWVLGTSTLSLAQENDAQPAPPPALPAEPAAPAESTKPLLVPDVRGLPLVFAKGVLEDAGFAWKVEGEPEGYAVNLVAAQNVAPGTQVVDNGAPVVLLRLRTNPAYNELGVPMNESPYPGTKLVLADGGKPEAASTPDAAEDTSDEGSDAGDESGDQAPDGAAENAEPSETDSSQDDGAGQAQGDSTDVELTGAGESTDDEESTRPPAFAVPGAPAEPLDEISLPERARELQTWADELDALGDGALDHFAYQHSWIVTGAGFGWWQGVEALRTLIRVDETMQSRFDVGGENEAQARAALAEVERKSNQ